MNILHFLDLSTGDRREWLDAHKFTPDRINLLVGLLCGTGLVISPEGAHVYSFFDYEETGISQNEQERMYYKGKDILCLPNFYEWTFAGQLLQYIKRNCADEGRPCQRECDLCNTDGLPCEITPAAVCRAFLIGQKDEHNAYKESREKGEANG